MAPANYSIKAQQGLRYRNVFTSLALCVYCAIWMPFEWKIENIVLLIERKKT